MESSWGLGGYECCISEMDEERERAVREMMKMKTVRLGARRKKKGDVKKKEGEMEL